MMGTGCTNNDNRKQSLRKAIDIPEIFKARQGGGAASSIYHICIHMYTYSIYHYVYIYIYIYTHISVYTCVYIYIYIYTHL